MDDKEKTCILMIFKGVFGGKWILSRYHECDLAESINTCSSDEILIDGKSYSTKLIKKIIDHCGSAFDVGYIDNEYVAARYLYMHGQLPIETKNKILFILNGLILKKKRFKTFETDDLVCEDLLPKYDKYIKVGEQFYHLKKNLIQAINVEKQESEEKAHVLTNSASKELDKTNSLQINVNEQRKQNNKEIKVNGLDEGTILNNKNYISNPAIGRENEIESLIITLAQNRKCPILVGESGVGKTAIVEQLVHMIKNNNVPAFLKDKIIVEVNSSDFIAGTKYRGTMEQKLNIFFETALKNNLILFIDEIHLMYSGACEDNNIDMASIMRYYIDRHELKVIGTTTLQEYNKYLANDSLKRRFDKIIVKEPTDYTLNIIIRKVFEDMSLKYNISSNNLLSNHPNIIDNLIEVTSNKHRVYNDRVNNPDLVVGIIDKSYAYAKVQNKETLEIEHILKSISLCDRIYESAKNEIIKRILNDNNIEGKHPKCKMIPFHL